MKIYTFFNDKICYNMVKGWDNMKKRNIIKYLTFAFMIFMIGSTIAFAGSNEYIQCGSGSIPAGIAPVTRVIVRMLHLAIPIAIIIAGSLDFLKAVIARDQEGIKKHQNQFVKRLVTAGIFFFVILIMKFTVSLVADNAESDVLKCVDCLISDESSCGAITTDNPFLYPGGSNNGEDNNNDNKGDDNN